MLEKDDRMKYGKSSKDKEGMKEGDALIVKKKWKKKDENKKLQK